MDMRVLIFLVFIFNVTVNVNGYIEWNISTPNAFDLDLYEKVLDSELCEVHLQYMSESNSTLRAKFLDAGIRLPRGILELNLVDMGNYFQCLNINEIVESEESSTVEGKYCSINIPLVQDLDLPEFPNITLPEGWPDLIWPELDGTLRFDDKSIEDLREYNNLRFGVQTLMRSNADQGMALNGELTVAICIPKVCTTEQAFNYIYFNTTTYNFTFTDNYCRLPNDKPRVAGDYVAIVIFSIIGLITILSTTYDVHHTFILKHDPKAANSVYQVFSIYTNTRRLLNFPSNPGALTCIDGIRSLAMMWIVLAHSFSAQVSGKMANPIDILSWTDSPGSLMISAALSSVDTFFMLSGLLIVYTTAGKLSSTKLLKNLHLFYLNRILRMFPILATVVLLQVSFFNRVVDGPFWDPVSYETHKCRNLWWSTLLHIQNYVNPTDICIAHSWYLAVDVQLHILSPLVLFWVLKGRKPLAWSAMLATLLTVMAAATVFNFHMNFPSGTVARSRSTEDRLMYSKYYYINTLTRAAPFFVGILVGYVLHLWRGKIIVISKLRVTILWSCAIILGGLSLYANYPVNRSDWDNQLLDNIINSFQRPVWAIALGWLIVACVHGYGGPINWFLSLSVWKLPARISYAMYLLHYPLMFIITGTYLAPVYFTLHFTIFRFFGNFTLAFGMGFIVTVLIDSPFSSVIKIALGGRTVSRPPKTQAVETNDGNNGQIRKQFMD